MNKALVSYAIGPHVDLLDIALPSFHEFADRHGYDVVIPEPLDCDRPPSWHKVPVLLAALDEYDEVLFLDADTVIIDRSEDLDVPADAWQALARHVTTDGEVPNCGVWFARKPMRPYLQQIWSLEGYLHHGWWEQAAMHQLLGYAGRPVTLVAPSELYGRTHWLDSGWNVHVWDQQATGRERVMHATMCPDRAAAMREWSSLAAVA